MVSAYTHDAPGLSGPPDDPAADAFERIVERLEGDRLAVLELDSYESELLDGDQYTRIFTALADAGGTHGLMRKLADLDIPAAYLDDYRALARLADDLHAVREQAIRTKAEQILDSEPDDIGIDDSGDDA